MKTATISCMIAISIALLPTQLKAQQLSATDMIEMSKCKSFDCYDSIIMNGKGFRLNKTEEIKDGVNYRYRSDKLFKPKENTTIEIGNNACFSADKHDDIVRYNSFSTSNKDFYYKLLMDFKKRGFTEKKHTAYTNAVVTTYTCARYPKLKLELSILYKTYEQEEYNVYNFELDVMQ